MFLALTLRTAAAEPAPLRQKAHHSNSTMAPSSKNKRKHHPDDDDESGEAIWSNLGLDPQDLRAVLRLDESRLAALLAHIAIQGDIKTVSLEKARKDLLASFLSTTWTDLAEEPSLNLGPRFIKNDFSQLELRECRLPPSFFKPLLATAWRFIDVYQEPGDQTREAACLRIFDPVCCSRLVTRSRL